MQTEEKSLGIFEKMQIEIKELQEKVIQLECDHIKEIYFSFINHTIILILIL